VNHVPHTSWEEFEMPTIEAARPGRVLAALMTPVLVLAGCAGGPSGGPSADRAFSRLTDTVDDLVGRVATPAVDEVG